MKLKIQLKSIGNTVLGFGIALLIWGTGLFLVNKSLIWFGVVFAQLVIAFYAKRNIADRIGLFLFMITMFMLNTGYFFMESFKGDAYNNWMINFIPSWSQEVKVSFIFLIAIVSSFIGEYISENIVNNLEGALTVKEQVVRYDLKALSKASQVVYYIGLICFALEIIEMITFTRVFGYNERYVASIRALPSIVYRLENLMWPGFFVFCASMPSKKEFNLPCCFLVGVSVLSLFSGSRGTFVLNILIVFLYFVFRQNFKNDSSEEWFTKKHLIMLVLIIPFAVFVLVAIQFWRHNEVMSLNVFEAIETLIGNSSGLLVFDELQYHDVLPKQIYVFGPIINYFKNNIIGGITGSRVVGGQTVDYALTGHSYAASMTYIIAPGSYLSGGGFGSAYIAEAFHDLSYFGVVFFSALFGFILGKSTQYLKRNYGVHPFIAAIILMMIQSILYAPRSTAISFVTESFFSFWTWISFGLILLVYSVISYVFR